MDLTAKKEYFASQMITTADEALLLAQKCEEIVASFNVSGFNAGAANAYVNGDFDASNKHLTAAAVEDIMFALGTISNAFTDGVKNSLRKALGGGLP